MKVSEENLKRIHKLLSNCMRKEMNKMNFK